jgi:hypothetical protein
MPRMTLTPPVDSTSLAPPSYHPSALAVAVLRSRSQTAAGSEATETLIVVGAPFRGYIFDTIPPS